MPALPCATLRRATLALVLAALACGHTTAAPASDPYAYTAPPDGGVPAALAPTAWKDPVGGQGHPQQDLEPYWAMTEARGSPEGNFPTWRTMCGALGANSERKPRMLGRQTSAFHSHEHALVIFLFGHYLAGTPAPLYFAFPPGEIETRASASTPYTLGGKVAGWEDQGEIAGAGGLHRVRVTFTELR